MVCHVKVWGTDRRGYDEVGVHFVVGQVALSLPTVPRLHLEAVVQLEQGRLSDVHPPATASINVPHLPVPKVLVLFIFPI